MGVLGPGSDVGGTGAGNISAVDHLSLRWSFGGHMGQRVGIEKSTFCRRSFSGFFETLFEKASPGDPKKVYFVGGSIESKKVIGQKRLGLKTSWDSNFPKNFDRNFLRPDLNSAY